MGETGRDPKFEDRGFEVSKTSNFGPRTVVRLARLSCWLGGCLLWLRRGGGFPLLAVWPGGLAVELLLNGLQLLPEGFHFLSQGLRGMRRGVGCTGFCWRLANRRGPFHLRRRVLSGGYGRRRFLQQLIIDGEKPVGVRSPCRRIKAIGPLGGARSEQQYMVLEA